MRGTATLTPVSIRRLVGGVGHTLITLGVLILLFVAYELWGTGIAEARSQHQLRKGFDSVVLGKLDPNTVPPPTPEGEAIAIIKIPKIGVEKAVVEGVGVEDLKKGPGHYPGTPLPGQPGNAAIAGHRTTYGAPFYRMDELKPGDPIFITTRQGPFRYQVRSVTPVSPTAIEVVKNTPDNRLTLTTCNPRFSATQRLITVADLIGPAAVPSPPPARFIHHPGLSGARVSKWPAFEWGALAALVALITIALSRFWRRWPAYFLGAPVFLLVLFVFFENFARLLPANV
jgi:sortase A